MTSERRRPALPGFERIGWLALVSPDMNPRVHDQTLCLDGSWTTETSVRFESDAVADAEQACSELALAAWTCGIEPDALLAFLLTGDTSVSAEKLRESVDAFVEANPGFRSGWWRRFVIG